MTFTVPLWMFRWLLCIMAVAVSAGASLAVFEVVLKVTTRIASIIGVHAELLWMVRHRKHVHKMWEESSR